MTNDRETPFVTFWRGINAHLTARTMPELNYLQARTVWDSATAEAAELACGSMAAQILAQAGLI